MTDQQLRDSNSHGFIPGPDESEEKFSQRIEYCRNLHNILSDHMGEEIPFSPKESTSLSFFQKASKKTQNLYGFMPDWVPIFFSNRQLSPWHGACAWIFQLKEDTPTSALLQLRKSLHHSKRLLGIYDRDELISHELVHVGRMMFEEPKFEELLAYRTSPSRFRRFFGPLIQSPYESFFFISVLIGIVALDFYLLLRYSLETYMQAQWLKGIPLLMAGYATFRLWRKQRVFNKCLKNLSKLLGEEKAYDVIYRLTDTEIKQFSTMKPTEISTYAQKESSLRWKVITLCYFLP